MNIFSDNDLKWIDEIEYTNKINYELEIRFRINDKNVYEKILSDFKSKNIDLKIHEKNIQDKIMYKDKFKIIKRKENDNNEICYTKKTLKSRYLDNIPGIMFLSSERKYNKELFKEDNIIIKNKKRISLTNEYISFDFTQYNEELSIEIEIINPHIYKNNICKLQESILEYINIFLLTIPVDMYVFHNINIYKKYIKQPFPLKNKDDIKYKFCVTPKFDGIRSQLYINNEKKVFIITNNFKNIIHTNLKTNNSNLLIDGELINNEVFFAFDLIMYTNNMLEDKCFFERLNILKYDIHIENIRSEISYEIKKYYFDDIYKDSKKILKKEYYYNYKDKKKIIPKDGLIFMDIKNNYMNSIILKWKKEITFDFKIFKTKSNDKIEEWCLKCYDVNNDYIVFKDKEYINIEYAINYNNEDIVEFKYNKSKNIFIPIKKRDDKELPNFINIAKDNMECLINTIKF